MISRLFIFLFFSAQTCAAQNWEVTAFTQLPEPISNNAVCEGFTPVGNYVYSFGGIDSTLTSNGIHLKTWRINSQTGAVDQIEDLPDTLGKIAAGASRIGNIIYVMGGYHVFQNGNELSSDKVHRFDIAQNTFIADGASIPVPIDDHVQTVYRDSLIFVTTGWSNTGNVSNVQIYDTYNNSWQSGTPVPNNNSYKCFGASGEILGDTLYYYGGAAGFNFNGQPKLRKGYINPNDPTQIDWSVETVSEPVYRAAATKTINAIHWIGGSTITYNYNGLAYNGSGPVSPAQSVTFVHPNSGIWDSETYADLPMDLRGIANSSATEKFIVGGIGSGLGVNDMVCRLTYVGTLNAGELTSETEPRMVVKDGLLFSDRSGLLNLYSLDGRLLLSQQIVSSQGMNIRGQEGVVVAQLIFETGAFAKKLYLAK